MFDRCKIDFKSMLDRCSIDFDRRSTDFRFIYVIDGGSGACSREFANHLHDPWPLHVARLSLAWLGLCGLGWVGLGCDRWHTNNDEEHRSAHMSHVNRVDDEGHGWIYGGVFRSCRSVVRSMSPKLDIKKLCKNECVVAACGQFPPCST